MTLANFKLLTADAGGVTFVLVPHWLGYWVIPDVNPLVRLSLPRLSTTELDRIRDQATAKIVVYGFEHRGQNPHHEWWRLMRADLCSPDTGKLRRPLCGIMATVAVLVSGVVATALWTELPADLLSVLGMEPLPPRPGFDSPLQTLPMVLAALSGAYLAVFTLYSGMLAGRLRESERASRTGLKLLAGEERVTLLWARGSLALCAVGIVVASLPEPFAIVSTFGVAGVGLSQAPYVAIWILTIARWLCIWVLIAGSSVAIVPPLYDLVTFLLGREFNLIAAEGSRRLSRRFSMDKKEE